MTTDREREITDEMVNRAIDALCEAVNKDARHVMSEYEMQNVGMRAALAAAFPIIMRENEALRADAEKWRSRHTMSEQELWGQS